MKHEFDHTNVIDGKQRISVPKKVKQSGKRRKQLKWIKITVIFGGICLLFVLLWVNYINSKNKELITEDVERNIDFANSGDLSWTKYSTLDIANELRNALCENTEEGIVEYILLNDEIVYSIGKIKGNQCEVTYRVTGYSFEKYMSYCRENSLQTVEDMILNFETYSAGHDKDYCSEVVMVYQKIDGRWVCDYNNPLFLDCMSCGMISAYKDYYNNSIDDVEAFINIINSEGEEDAEE